MFINVTIDSKVHRLPITSASTASTLLETLILMRLISTTSESSIHETRIHLKRNNYLIKAALQESCTP